MLITKKLKIDGKISYHGDNVLMQLRKICNHPYIFDGVEPKDAPLLGDHLFNTCGKMILLDKLLKKLNAGNHQVLIFS